MKGAGRLPRDLLHHVLVGQAFDQVGHTNLLRR